MFFVSDVPNNGQNVLDIMVTKPNRERQKLMREQNILKQVPAHEEAAGTKRQRLFCLQLVSSCALPAVSHHLFFFFPLWPQHAVARCGISVPRPGTEPGLQWCNN